MTAHSLGRGKCKCTGGAKGKREAWKPVSLVALQRIGRVCFIVASVCRYDKMRAAKAELAGSLTSLTLNAEKRKEERLNSIMKKLKADGVVFPGAALASLTEE